MRFVVTGADHETGEDVEFVVSAGNKAEAMAKANRRGILVSSCASGAEHAQPSHETGAVLTATDERATPTTSHNVAKNVAPKSNRVKAGLSNVLAGFFAFMVVGGIGLGALYYMTTLQESSSSRSTAPAATVQEDPELVRRREARAQAEQSIKDKADWMRNHFIRSSISQSDEALAESYDRIHAFDQASEDRDRRLGLRQ